MLIPDGQSQVVCFHCGIRGDRYGNWVFGSGCTNRAACQPDKLAVASGAHSHAADANRDAAGGECAGSDH
jgi:hypothetical protein